MKKFGFGLLLCVLAAPAMAQMMPAPRSAPHTAVNRESIAERRAAQARDISGQALIIDGEKLRIDDVDLRLFGVVPPQLSASFGPQARATLDAVIGGGQTIACHVRDRDHDGRLLATCRSANGADPALELLRRGLAVAARGSIAETELAQPYVSAELAAQNEKLGLWSVMAPAASAAVPAPVIIEAPKPEAPKPEVVAAKASDVQPKTSSAVLVPVKAPVVEAVKEEPKAVDNSGTFARYQILIAGALMLATALSILLALGIHRAREKRDEMKALAAALRGELLAARAVCLTRIKHIATEGDDRNASWPRIRSTLYQAYVGKLGWLGAELARQVASIYGQASDYASYYNSLTDTNASVAMPKRQALQTLAAHIEEVLPRLAAIEQTGQKTTPPVYPTVATMPVQPVVAEMPAPMMAITSSRPVAEPVTPEQSHESKLRGVVRHLRERFAETRSAPADEPMGDYTSIIEEDMQRYSFGGDEDGETSPIGKVGRP